MCFVAPHNVKTNLGQSSKMNRFHLLLWLLISLEPEDLATLGTLCQLLARDSDIVNCTPYICQGQHHSHSTFLGSCTHLDQMVGFKMLSAGGAGVHCSGVLLACAGSTAELLSLGVISVKISSSPFKKMG